MNKGLLGLIAVFFVLAACNGTPSAVLPPKTFTSNWAESGQFISVDFTKANLNGTFFSASYYFADTSTCTCSFQITKQSGSGNQTSGTINSSCGTGTGPDALSICPNVLNYSGGTYTHDNATLTICQPNHGICLGYQ